MSGFSNSSANAIVNYHLRGLAASTVRLVYFALFTADPTDAFSAGTEVSASWYVRQLTGAWAAPVNGVTYNTTRASFPAVTGVGVTVTYVGIVEGASATDGTSTLLYSHALSTPKTLAVNDIFIVDSTGTSGDYTLSLL